jgi:hypothetical protein
MRSAILTTIVASFVAVASTVAFAELKSGPQVGEGVDAYTVTKIAGNAEDGITDGQHLCYRCKTGSRPVVMVFARSADEKLAKMLKKIEEEVEEHQADKLTAFVNMIGADAESLKKASADFVAKHGIKRIAFVVPDEPKNGPSNYNLSPEADLTVICYKGGMVKANHAFAKGGLTDEKIEAVVEASCDLVD